MSDRTIVGLLVAAAIFILVVVMYDPAARGDPIVPEFDRTDQIIRLRVVLHDDLRGVREAKLGTMPAGSVVPEGLLGFAGWNNINTYCEVHLVRPERSLDDRVLTLGHEVLHLSLIHI